MLLLEIGGKCISYASYRKKESFKLEKEILSDIKQLENNLMEGDVYVLEQKRHELLELRQKKLDSMIVRSRAKWLYEDEEKKIFL